MARARAPAAAGARRRGRLAAGSALALALAGCVVGPKYRRPAPPPASALPVAQPVADRAGGEPAQRTVAGREVAGRWWTLFESPALSALVDRALARNADLEAARAALRQARETYLAARGAYWPTIEAGPTVSFQKNPAVLASPLSSNADYFSLYGAQVAVSYVPDVFGGVRRQVQSSAALADAQRFQLEATYLTLTANLAVAAVQAAAVREQIAATRRLIDTQVALLEVLRRQLAAGQAASADVAAQALALAQAKAALPPLQKQLDQLDDQVAALAGGYPTDPAPQIAFANLHLPAELPDAVPARLVEQRPDIRAAEANLRSANAQVGVAAAARLPNIVLSASLGAEATDIGRLLTQGDQAWALGAGLTQPVFQGGALKHRQRAAEAALDQARAQYRSTVIASCQNVADVMHALKVDAEAVAVAQAGEAAAGAARAVAERRYAAGETGSGAVLSARQAYEQGLITLSQARAQRFVDTIALFQALGGGWWSRTDAAG